MNFLFNSKTYYELRLYLIYIFSFNLLKTYYYYKLIENFFDNKYKFTLTAIIKKLFFVSLFKKILILI